MRIEPIHPIKDRIPPRPEVRSFRPGKPGFARILAEAVRDLRRPV